MYDVSACAYGQVGVSLCENMVNNHYLALYAAARGAIYSDSEPQICCRIHGGNQTKVLSMIFTKEEHIFCRQGNFIKRIEELSWRRPFPELNCAEQ